MMKTVKVKPSTRKGRYVKGHVRTVSSTSSHIKSYKYDSDLEDLVVRFKKGGSYVYADVPSKVVDGLDAAESKGKYFWKRIRNKYNYSKL